MRETAHTLALEYTAERHGHTFPSFDEFVAIVDVAATGIESAMRT
jgi:hypothetical protein